MLFELALQGCDDSTLKSWRLGSVPEGKCLTVLAGMAMPALDESYSVVNFRPEEMYGDVRADI